MWARPALPIACVVLLILSASTGADYVSPAAAEPVRGPPIDAPAKTPALTPAPQPTPAPVPTAAAPEATPAPQAAPAPAPTPGATPEVTPAPQAAPAPASTAAAAPEATPAPQVAPAAVAMAPAAPEATPAPQATSAPALMAPATPQLTPAPQATSAPALMAPATVQATPPRPRTLGPTPLSGCATPYEFWDGDECRAPSAVCSLLGTDDDDLLTGTPMDRILCGFDGDDQHGDGDGDHIRPGGKRHGLLDGDDDDCVVPGPGPLLDKTPERPEPPADNGPTPPSDVPPEPPVADVGAEAPVPPEPEIPIPPEYQIPLPAEPPLPDQRVSPDSGVPHDRRAAPKAALPVRVVGRGGDGSAGAAPVAGPASVAASGGVSRGLPCGGPFIVRRGWVRLCVPCSVSAPAKLVVFAGSRRIARKRFFCRSPVRTVRVRLNATGRRLVVRERRVPVRMRVRAAGRAVSSWVLLVSSRD